MSNIQTPGGSANTGNFLSVTRYETLDDVRSRLFNLKLQNNRYYTVELPNICHTPLCKINKKFKKKIFFFFCISSKVYSL
jgi:hypothetical protein